jgi:hypothetical protein
MSVSFTNIKVVLRENAGIPVARIEAHEVGHVRQDLEVLEQERASAEALESKTYPNRAVCRYACELWEANTRRKAFNRGMWHNIVDLLWY